MSVATWNAVLQRNGFSGVDVFCQDSDTTKDQQLSPMIATREDDREKDILREEFAIVEPVAGLNHGLDAVSTMLSERLSVKGVPARRVQWSPDLSSCRGRHCIVLMELESPFLTSLKEEDFLALKQLVNEVSSLLWVTRGGDPTMEMIFGLSRTLRSEVSGLNFRVLRIDDELKLEADALVKPILDVAISEVSDNEFVFQDGVVNIARFVEEKVLNEMIADQSRKVQPEVMPMGKSPAPLKLEIGMPGMLDTLFFIEDSKAAEDLGVDEVEIRVKASGLK
jgi:hypothetical protein